VKRFITILTLLFSILLKTQTPVPSNWDHERKENCLRIAFYNVENLFDTIDDPKTRDEEYLPTAEKNWNSYKYFHKLNNLSKVIVALGGWEAPDLVGLCEVENKLVVEDLTQTAALRKNGYGVVHFDSPDKRGIDVGLIYKKEKFEPIHSENLSVKLINDTSFYTRDILYVKGLSFENEIHVFVNHWPSRRGGAEQSEHKRIRAAQVLKNKVDSIVSSNPESRIIIMGDFNDTPQNNSIEKTLNAGESLPPKDLLNLMGSLPSSAGSHKYKGHWAYLDQLIVSDPVSQIIHFDATVFFMEWMLNEDSKYPGFYPKRTWSGNFYKGGYSDHLPIFFDICISYTK
jgi:predicted extracellular nuclease